jgi:hypothetical protein
MLQQVVTDGGSQMIFPVPQPPLKTKLAKPLPKLWA